MANYSDDTRLKVIDSEMFNWLEEGKSFNEIRDFVTRRITLLIQKSPAWETLLEKGLVTEEGLVDKAKILNPEDLEDLEDLWVREVVYFDHLNAAKEDDAIFWKARVIRSERLQRLRSLVLLIDEDGDGVADGMPLSVWVPFRS
ncbi:MAG: hypothetical protein N2234_00210 [Planctomycetota bacterium]|nr:hypothetical protein [Planctomycetota bacterium]